MVILPSSAPPAQTRARGRNKRPRPGRKQNPGPIKASTSAARKWIRVHRTYGKITLPAWVAIDALTPEEKVTHGYAPPVVEEPDAAEAPPEESAPGIMDGIESAATALLDPTMNNTQTAEQLAAAIFSDEALAGLPPLDEDPTKTPFSSDVFPSS